MRMSRTSFTSSHLPILICVLTAGLFLSGCGTNADLKDPNEVLERARNQMLSYNIKDAKETLEAHSKLFSSEMPQYPEYQYFYALGLLHTIPPVPSDVEKAEVMLLDLVTKYPDYDRASSAWYYIGRIRDLRDYKNDAIRLGEARDAYRKILEEYPDSIEAGEAAARYAVTFMKYEGEQEADFEKGVTTLEEWLVDNPDSPQASSLTLFLAQMLDIYIKDSARSLAYYQMTYEKGFNNQGQAGAKIWRMAELALEVGQKDNAVLYAQDIIRHYSRSGRAYEAKLMLETIQKENPDMDFEIPDLQLFEMKEAGE